MARAIRAVVASLEISSEVFSLDLVREEIHKSLRPPRARRDCLLPPVWKNLERKVQIAVTDIDQAFEACSADRVLPCWKNLCKCFWKDSVSMYKFGGERNALLGLVIVALVVAGG